MRKRPMRYRRLRAFFSVKPHECMNAFFHQTNWYCVKARHKREHIAARHIGHIHGVEVFMPRISYRKATRTGAKRFIEPLFPSYFFSRFCPADHLDKVRFCESVLTVVHFRGKYSVVPSHIIEALRLYMGLEETLVIREDVSPGDKVKVATGVFKGLDAVVTTVMPARERVRVLLDFLGRQTAVELPAESVVPQDAFALVNQVKITS
jgi:transcriptional antiterminator RfaH